MSYSINAGLSLSIDKSTWYQITDDNRQPLDFPYEIVEKSSRMAEGTLRRYVVVRKQKISTSWSSVWSSSTMTSDGNKGGAWLKSFYDANVFIPIYLKTTNASVNTQNISTTSGFIPTETQATISGYTSGDTYISSFTAPNSTNNVYYGFITGFDYKVVKRSLGFDLVDITFEFTEM